MITVFSMEDSPYHSWQADLLAHSFHAAGMPGPLVPVVHAPHHAYAGLHKIEDLTGWAAQDAKSTEPVLVIDPDFVFVRACEFDASPGRALGQPIGYMQPAGREDLIARHCPRPELFAPVGVPLVIARCDLAALAGPWMAATERVMADPRWGAELGWVCDMWGYVFACAGLGITHDVRPMAAFPDQETGECSMVHYCYDVPASAGFPGWGKRTWRPETPVLTPGPETLSAGRVLLETLRSADLTNHEAEEHE